MGVLQYVQRRLRIPRQRRCAQHPGHLGLCLCAPPLFRILGHLVAADQRPILGRGHVQRERQRVAFQAQLGRLIDLLKTRLGGGDDARFIR